MSKLLGKGCNEGVVECKVCVFAALVGAVGGAWSNLIDGVRASNPDDTFCGVLIWYVQCREPCNDSKDEFVLCSHLCTAHKTNAAVHLTQAGISTMVCQD